MAVQRWRPVDGACLEQTLCGEFVAYADHAAEVARLEARLVESEDWIKRREAQLVEQQAKLQAFADAGFARPDGWPAKVVGTLARTADGVFVGDCAEVWINDAGNISKERIDKIGVTQEVGMDSAFFPVEECCSTEVAARAAMGKA